MPRSRSDKQDPKEPDLPDSRRMLQTLMGNLPGMAFRCRADENWTMLFVSEGCRELTGYDAGELINNSKVAFNGLIARDDREMVRRTIQDALSARKPYHVSYRIHPRGQEQVKWVYEKGCGIYDAKGEVEAVEGFITDISELKRAEEALRDSQQRLELAIEASREAFWDWDITTGKVKQSPLIRQCMGDTSGQPDSALFDEWKAALHPDDAADAIARLQEHLDGRSDVFAAEYRIRTRDGQEKWIRSRGRVVARDADGKPLRMVGVQTDITDQKVAQHSTEASEEKYRKLMETAGDAIFIADAESACIIDCNPAAERLLGKSHQEIIGLHQGQLHPPEEEQRMRKQFQLDLKRGGSQGHDSMVIRKDGQRVWVNIMANTLEVRGRKLIMGIFHDISERRRSEQALLESNEKLLAIVDFLPDATFVIDRDRNVIAWNRAMEEMTGVSKDAVLGKGHYIYGAAFYGEPHPMLIDLIEEQSPEAEEKYDYVTRVGSRLFGELYVPTLFDCRGAHVWATASPLLDGQGNIVGAIESIRDVTSRRRAELAAQDAQARLQKQNAVLTELAGDPRLLRLDDNQAAARHVTSSVAGTLGVRRCGIWRLDAQHRRLTCIDSFDSERSNDPQLPAIELSRCPLYFQSLSQQRVIVAENVADDLRLKDFLDHCASEPDVASAIDAPIRRHGQVVGIVRVEHVGQSRPWTADEQTFVASIADLVALAMEAAELRQKEDQFLQAQKMEAVGRLAGGVAHDFNNQLTVVKGYCDLMLRELPAQSDTRRILEEIRNAAVRAESLTSQLLAFSRKQMLQPQVLNLNQVLEELGDPLTRMIGQDIRLRIVGEKQIRNVLADPNQVKQAIVNLVINARDAMPDGGTLTLETRNVDLRSPLAAQPMEVPPGQYVVLRVTDTGTGMDQATLTQIFEPFFTTKPTGQGTGLGLAMVYGFVRQSGGYITVASHVGQGSQFDIYLQVVAEQAQVEPSPQSQPPPHGHEDIMVVEDDPAVRALLVRLLSNLGYRVRQTGEVELAMKVLKDPAHKCDLLVTDVVMPGMSGLQLAKEARRLHPHLPVLYITGYADRAIRSEDFLPDRSKLLLKPFRTADLAEAVRDLLEDKDAPEAENQ